MYIIRQMRVRIGGVAAALLSMTAIAAGCGNPLGRQYEYEEQIYLGVDGSATILVDSSLPALVALHGVPIDPSPHGLTDREEIRRLFDVGACRVVRVGQPWRRSGRRFVQVRLETADIRKLNTCGPLGWSASTFDVDNGQIHYRQTIGPPTAASPGAVNWDGSELVGFKLHLPSRILSHNVRRLDNGATGDVERGNILTWEQTLADRRAGEPVDIDVRMEAESILGRTLWLFAGAFLAAAATLAVVVWWIVRRGKRVSRLRPA